MLDGEVWKDTQAGLEMERIVSVFAGSVSTKGGKRGICRCDARRE